MVARPGYVTCRVTRAEMHFIRYMVFSLSLDTLTRHAMYDKKFIILVLKYNGCVY